MQTFTEDGPQRPTLRGNLSVGSHGLYRAAVNFGGTQGSLNYVIDAARFETDGYRDHSSARRDHINGKFKFSLAGGAKLTAVVNALEQPDTEDPLGLTRAQFAANPRQVAAPAITFNTRKSIQHRQTGLIFEQPFGADVLRVAGYAGARDVRQYPSIPLAAQAPPSAAGGVVDLDREFGGLSLRYTVKRDTGAGVLKLTGGVEYDRVDERRRGFVNNNGVAGVLKRDQDDTVSTADLFAIGEWSIAPKWSIAGGARMSRARFNSQDYFIAAGNPDDSGSVRHTGRSAALGLMYKHTEVVHYYANIGRGFETPTLAE